MKFVKYVFCVIFILIIVNITFASEWVQDGDRWRYKIANEYVTDTVKYIGNQAYRFDSDGYLMTGIVDINGSDYFFEKDGTPVKEKGIKKDGTYYRTTKYGKLVESNSYGVDYDFDIDDGSSESENDTYKVITKEKKIDKQEWWDYNKKIVEETRKAQEHKTIEYKKYKEGVDVIVNDDYTLTKLDGTKITSDWVEIYYIDKENGKDYSIGHKYYYDEKGNRVIGPKEIDGKYYLFNAEDKPYSRLKSKFSGDYTFTTGDEQELPAKYYKGELVREVKIKEYIQEKEKYENRQYSSVVSVEDNAPEFKKANNPVSEAYSNYIDKGIELDKNDENVLYIDFGERGSFIAPKEMKVTNGIIQFLSARIGVDNNNDNTSNKKVYRKDDVNYYIILKYKAIPSSEKVENVAFDILSDTDVTTIIASNYNVEIEERISLMGNLRVKVEK